jgi:exodeoxyribonuclease V beta subunit
MDLDLKRHNAVEASAGTGKTYTIEQLVLRLVIDEEIELDRLLVVTFTEKATGELKNRLRARLEKALQEQPAKRPLLQRCLDSFDQAPISTIHSFCQNLLREFPLEQGQDFALELTPREHLAQPALREVQRTVWPALFGADLARILADADYRRGDATKWEKNVLLLAARYRPRWGHVLRPDPGPTDASGTALAVRTVAAVVEQMQRIQERRGLYTFDDMIERVALALDPDENPAAEMIAARLRQRYACAIVDEFQDTDPIQWSILKRIFVDGKQNRLFLVGDPKQAIFAFRGADLPTYIQARAELVEKHGGKRTELQVNWRSTPELLTGLNTLFQASTWFGDQSGVSYAPVRAAPSGEARYRVDNDDTGRAAINLLDLRAAERLGGEARPRNAAFVAAEIGRLLARPEAFRFSADGKPTVLAPSHIAILVFKRLEASGLSRALHQRGIPFTFYKQTGLWESAEALQIGCALDALARPEDRRLLRRLLLTRFFRVSPQELAGAEDLPDHHPARALVLDWLDLAERGAWSALFRSMIEDSALLPHSDVAEKEEERDFERCLANMRHLRAALEHAAYRDSLDIHGLLAFFRNQQQRPEADEGDYQPIETQAPKVQILTVHASKGLEFPIVFLAGGFTAKQLFATGVGEYRDQGQRVFHYPVDKEAQERHNRQKLDEDRRLLYVALTRAMFKLYVPLVRADKDEAFDKGARDPGPLCTLLRPALDAAGLAEMKPPVAQLIPEVVPGAVPDPGATADAAPRNLNGAEPIQPASPLFPPRDDTLCRRRIVMASFSSLRRREQREQEVFFGEFLDRLDDDEPDTLDEPDPLRGAEFGDLVHRILEKIDWTEAAAARTPEALWREGSPARRLLDTEIRHTLPALPTRLPPARVESACRDQVGRLVWLALKTPLAALGAAVADIPARDCLREIEFLFPDARPRDGKSRLEEGFVTGFIDLILRKDSRYYLADWKTNLLDAYDPPALAEAMRASDYTRQYRLYALALGRWLERVHGPDFSFAKHFGGVFYLFLRGLNGGADTAGVFFVNPQAEELRLERVLTT